MTGTPVVEVHGFSKTFAGRRVLDSVDLAVAHGEIHALVGQNGSGKSTFIKILAGYHAPDPGASLTVRGQAVPLPVSFDTVNRRGLSFVHQDLGLFEDGTVLENLLIGQYRTQFGWRIPWREERRRVRGILTDYELEVAPDAPLASLSDVERAILAIARALIHLPTAETALLVLDEPTARLPHHSTAEFFDRIRALAHRGHGILFVSHRLDEVAAIADVVTVLRDGRVVACHQAPDITVPQLVQAMLGFAVTARRAERSAWSDEPIARVADLAGGVVEQFDAVVHRGEILGLTGLLGMGHDSVPYLLFGAQPARRGTVDIGGTTLPLDTMTPRTAMRAGLALLPGNRARDAAVGEASARENLTLATLDRYVARGIIDGRRERREAQAQMQQFEVSPPDPEAAMATFSGGNQQKTLLAKWLAARPRLLVLDEPWHGVDVGAKQQIMQLLVGAAAEGMAILIASVEAGDLAEVCHRVLVMRRGRVASESAGADLTAARISEQVQLDGAGGDRAEGCVGR